MYTEKGSGTEHNTQLIKIRRTAILYAVPRGRKDPFSSMMLASDCTGSTWKAH